MKSLRLAEKEASHVTQITSHPTSSQREIARVAHIVFPSGNVFIQIRDTLGAISTDDVFADLFPTHGQPALAPWRLALVTVFQFLEHLTDRQAADAVRDRLAWKYATPPGTLRSGL